jgi:hypothetical protein
VTVSTTARRTLAAAALAPLLLTGFAACGDDGDDSGSGTDAGGSAAGSAVLADLSEGDEVAPQEFVDTVAAGLEESTTAHLEMTMSLGEQLTTESEGDLDYTTEPPSLQMTMDIPGAGEMDMVMVDGVIYMKSDRLTDDKYWKMDVSDPDSPLGQMGLGKLLEQSDPVGALKSMQDGIDTVTFEGTEDVDGRELDRYELTIDVKSVMDSLGSDLPGAAGDEVPDSVTYDLWLDDQDRFAQMQMDLPVMDRDVTMEMTLDDWGQDVSIEAPPADEVTDMPMSGMMGGTPS